MFGLAKYIGCNTFFDENGAGAILALIDPSLTLTLEAEESPDDRRPAKD
jgi:hypothetical protein